MRVLLVGNMVASCNAFDLLKKELECHRHIVPTILTRGQEWTAEDFEFIYHEILTCQSVVVGMASSEKLAKGEVFAAEGAIKNNIPLFFFSDTFGTYGRPWFKSLIRDCGGTIFVVNDIDVARAREFYPNSNVITTGNPTWEDFPYPKVTRDEVRTKLGATEDQLVILCPLGKDVLINMLHAVNVLNAANEIGRKVMLVICVHAGDPTGRDLYEQVFAEDESKKSWNPATVIIATDRASDMLPGADLVIGFSSGVGTEAGFQKKPVINFFPSMTLRRHNLSIDGKGWYPAEQGAEAFITSADKLAGEIQSVLSERGLYLREKQSRLYPIRERGTSVHIMIDAIESSV